MKQVKIGFQTKKYGTAAAKQSRSICVYLPFILAHMFYLVYGYKRSSFSFSISAWDAFMSRRTSLSISSLLISFEWSMRIASLTSTRFRTINKQKTFDVLTFGLFHTVILPVHMFRLEKKANVLIAFTWTKPLLFMGVTHWEDVFPLKLVRLSNTAFGN